MKCFVWGHSKGDRTGCRGRPLPLDMRVIFSWPTSGPSRVRLRRRLAHAFEGSGQQCRGIRPLENDGDHDSLLRSKQSRLIGHARPVQACEEPSPRSTPDWGSRLVLASCCAAGPGEHVHPPRVDLFHPAVGCQSSTCPHEELTIAPVIARASFEARNEMSFAVSTREGDRRRSAFEVMISAIFSFGTPIAFPPIS